MRWLPLVVLAACHAQPRPPAEHSRVVVEISALAEWKAFLPLVRSSGRGAEVHDAPFGQWLVHRVGNEDVVFMHGGYTKSSAAAATQYAIDRWHPKLIVNLGTCGGFAGRKPGDIVLVDETIIYDIYERMGDADEAVNDFRTKLDISAWPARLLGKVVVGPIASGDRDLVPTEVGALHAKYNVTVGDWESASIAWVAAKNHVPALILRGVTDTIDAGGSVTDGNPDAWERATAGIMATLFALVNDAVPDLR